MKRRAALLLSLAFGAAPAWAQTSKEKEAAAAAQPAKPAPERPALKLRLDEVSGGRERIGYGNSEKAPARELPSLGADARTLPVPPAGTPNSPFPKDTATQFGR